MLNFLPAPLQSRQWESMHDRKAWRKEKDTLRYKEDVQLCRELLQEVLTFFEKKVALVDFLASSARSERNSPGIRGSFKEVEAFLAASLFSLLQRYARLQNEGTRRMYFLRKAIWLRNIYIEQ